jgi:ubiquitin-protein ligase E3 B
MHRSVWPRVVFSLGSAAKLGPSCGVSPSIPDVRVLYVLSNVVEITSSCEIEGLQLIYLSALERLLSLLPADALAVSAQRTARAAEVQQQMQSLTTAAHVHWLLRGLGGQGPTPVPSGTVSASGGSSGLGNGGVSSALGTFEFGAWQAVYSDVGKKKGSDGRVMYAEAVQGFCCAYALLLRLWSAAAVQMLNALAFDSPVHVCLWAWLKKSGCLQKYIDDGTESDLVSMVTLLFCKTYLHRLMVTDDVEFYETQTPFPLAELVDMALLLRQYVNKRFWGREEGTGAVAARLAISGQAVKLEMRQMQREAATQLMHQLYDRNARREFCPIDTWLQRGFKMDAFGINSTADDSQTLVVLREFPHVIPLNDRVRILQRLIAEDRQSQAWPEVHVKIRRHHVVEDGFSKLNALRADLKGVVKVHFVNESGLDESGIDMGGLYKEFLTSLIEKAFNPDYGLFKMTANRQLYPNPNSHVVHNHLEYFAFLGRVLGKSVFDGIQMDVPFCGFFLSKLLGKHNYLDELPSLDPDLHKNLMYLKEYKGDVTDLALDFSVQTDDLGGGSIYELIPGGSKVDVNNGNRIQYIHLMADYRLNRQIRRQCDAFLRGFQDVIRVEWIRFFNPVELQVLISGERNGDFDVADLRAHTVYSGGFSDSDSVCRKFWKVVGMMTPREKSLLLKFVTSCPRAPLLGFASLHPQFCIHRVRSTRSFMEMLMRKEEDRLPTASTCMNLLKLPEYLSTKTLRDKLLYAITANAGFELS